MLDFQIFLDFILSIFLGTLIGLEREKTYSIANKSSFAGIRTFALIGMLGYIIGLLGIKTENMLLVPIGFLAIILLVGISTYISYKKNDSVGITTEISVLIAFCAGILVCFDLKEFAIATSIVAILILSLQQQIHGVVNKISKEEVFDSIKFAIVAFVILPLLPNQYVDNMNLFNPYKIWLMVVFVSSVGYIGYILTKVVGAKKGIRLTGLIGGLISSTAVTSGLSNLSKRAKDVNPFVFGVLISSSIMLVRVGIEVFVFNKSLLPKLLIPLGTMLITGIIISMYFFIKNRNNNTKEDQNGLNVQSPFSLKPALFFGLFFAFIIAISKIALMYLPAESLYIVAILSGLADVDAITLTIASIKSLDPDIATTAIILATITNTAVKGGFAYILGSKKFAKNIIISFSIISIMGILSLIFM